MKTYDVVLLLISLNGIVVMQKELRCCFTVIQKWIGAVMQTYDVVLLLHEVDWSGDEDLRCCRGDGTAGPCPSHDAWRYDGRTRQWSQLDSCPAPRFVYLFFPSVPFRPSFCPSFLPSFLLSFVPSVFSRVFRFFVRSFVRSFFPCFLSSFLLSFVPSVFSSVFRSFICSCLHSFFASFLPSVLRPFRPSFCQTKTG